MTIYGFLIQDIHTREVLAVCKTVQECNEARIAMAVLDPALERRSVVVPTIQFDSPMNYRSPWSDLQ